MLKRRVTIRKFDGAIDVGKGQRVDEWEDTCERAEIPAGGLIVPDLKPGEGVAVRLYFYRPLPMTPGRKVFEKLREGGAIPGSHASWEDMGSESREMYEAAAMESRQ